MHVAFDMDGVLLDVEANLEWLERALNDALTAVGVEPTAQRRALLHPRNLRDFPSAARELGVDPDTLWPRRHDAYVREKTAAIHDGEIGPFPDVDRVHDIAAEYPVSVISNSPQPIVDTFLTDTGLDSTVEVAIGRGSTIDALDRMKPDPAYFETLHSQVGEEEYVYVGDTSSDALFAGRTGMDFIHLNRERGPIDSMAAVERRLSDRE
ncbi:MAG: HAD family hydrolase [Halodesulfurarchaeum sp.]